MDYSELRTPCYLLDEVELRNNISGFKKALDDKFPQNILGYSLKTNSLPYVLSVANSMGVYAEVVSYTEYALAVSVGFSKDHIIYNGPMKDKETFLDAIRNKAIVNIETKREIDWLKELNSDNQYQVGIRVNLNLNEISPEDAKEHEGESRFGFSFENGELGKAIQQIKTIKNITLAGLHLHRTSLTRSTAVYRNICIYACKIIKEFNLKLDYLDIGGGYFGNKPGAPTYQDYTKTIRQALEGFIDFSKTTIVVEPGNGIIASPIDFLSSVIDYKKISDTTIVVTDGSRNDIDPFFNKKNYFKEFEYYGCSELVAGRQIIVGCSCLEYDKLFTIENQKALEKGDRIRYKCVGAYTMELSPLFIRYFPRVYAKNGQDYREVRKEWTAENYNI